MTQYRKLYADFYGITWDPKEMEVHHIDYDHSNNDIGNLILLPTKLHRLLHKAYAEVLQVRAFGPSTDALLKEITREGLVVGASIAGDAMDAYMAVLDKCANWCLLRNVHYCRPWGELTQHITPEINLLG